MPVVQQSRISTLSTAFYSSEELADRTPAASVPAAITTTTATYSPENIPFSAFTVDHAGNGHVIQGTIVCPHPRYAYDYYFPQTSYTPGYVLPHTSFTPCTPSATTDDILDGPMSAPADFSWVTQAASQQPEAGASTVWQLFPNIAMLLSPGSPGNLR